MVEFNYSNMQKKYTDGEVQVSFHFLRLFANLARQLL